MTTPYRGRGAESPFSDWIRNASELDSVRESITVNNTDLIIHRYATPNDKRGDRLLQALMFVEIKTHNAAPSESQRDTLNIFDQLLRHRPGTPTRGRLGKHAADHRMPAKVYSLINRRDVRILLFGGHLLTLSGERPDEANCRICWSGASCRKNTVIDYTTLIGLLRFERDPDTLSVRDWRRRHAAPVQADLLTLPRAIA